MTDAQLVAKKLAFIETCVRDLRSLAHPERIADDIREQRFVIYTLQIAIQAAQDVALHIVSDERFGEPESNRELFDLLARNGWLAPELAGKLTAMVGLRNVVVHGYAGVNLPVIRDVVENHLEDLLAFTADMGARL